MNNYCQVLLSFILQCEDYKSTTVNTLHRNEHRYIPKDYNGLIKVESRISSQGDTRYVVPFIAFLGNNQTIKKGYYPVFLYYRKNKKLILAYGISVTNQGESWDFNKLGIKQPDTIGQEFGTDKHDTKYDTSYVRSVYDVSNVVNHFRNIDVTDDTIYQTEAVSKYGFEKQFPIDDDLKDICSNYIKQLNMASGTTVNNVSVPSGGVASTEPYPHNIILYGPPGTGKTYNTIRYALAIAEGLELRSIVGDQYTDLGGKTKSVKDSFDEFTDPSKQQLRIVFTTFHQSLSYEDFIEGIKPKVNESQNKQEKSVYYEKEAGVFKRICQEARGKKDNYVLIIDEINRGNVAQIFGELITLIEEDKREGAKNELWCTLPYSGERFSVPNNLYIIGTMNTADRSVEALDSALRRRFQFFEMLPNDKQIPNAAKSLDVFKTINKRISILKDSEHQIGHSYFMAIQNELDLYKVFRYNIIPLLQEYFFGDMERIKMVIGKGFVKEETVTQSAVFPNYSGDVDIPSSIIRLWNADEWDTCKKDIEQCLVNNTQSSFAKTIDTLLNG